MKNIFDHEHKMFKLFIALAWLAIISAIAILLLVGYWSFRPYHIVDVKQPFEVLNANNEVAINTDLLLEISLDVKLEYRPISAPTIVCKSGNLVQLASNLPADIPLGEYTFEADPVNIPPKFSIDDECQYVAILRWQVNPIRVVEKTYYSEYFTIKAPIKE